jgi:hypothetical protein
MTEVASFQPKGAFRSVRDNEGRRGVERRDHVSANAEFGQWTHAWSCQFNAQKSFRSAARLIAEVWLRPPSRWGSPGKLKQLLSGPFPIPRQDDAFDVTGQATASW